MVGKVGCKTEKSENGGKDVVLVAVSSLSKQARNAWKEREKLKSFTEEFPDKKEDEQKPEVPWYVNTDVDWYIENYKERYYKAVELGNVVRKFLQYDEGDRTKYAEEFAQKYLGKGQRTLYRYTKAYLEASAWADKLEKEDGAGREFFKVLCLCRKPKETGCFPSIKPEVKQVIKNIWFNEDFARNQGTREMLYEKLTAIANINKWEKIPSYQTVTRYISYLMEDEGMRNAWFLASRGTREYKNKVMVKGSRDTKGLQVMQIVMGDEHTFDCWVSYKQPNGKVIAIKPHLAAWVDMRSRQQTDGRVEDRWKRKSSKKPVKPSGKPRLTGVRKTRRQRDNVWRCKCKSRRRGPWEKQLHGYRDINQNRHFQCGKQVTYPD